MTKPARLPFYEVFPFKSGTMSDEAIAAVTDCCLLTIKTWRAQGVPQNRLHRCLHTVPYVAPKAPAVVKVRTPEKRGRKKKPVGAREINIAHAYVILGRTLQEIGNEYGITRERIRQILAKLGIAGSAGGRALRSMVSVRYKQQARKTHAERVRPYWGCSFAEARRLNAGQHLTAKDTPAYWYKNQRNAAKFRGIEWQMTFPEWLRIWQESGHFHERGRGHGYVMTRVGDTGPYAADNVEIKTQSENSKESYYKHPAAERRVKAIHNRLLREQQRIAA